MTSSIPFSTLPTRVLQNPAPFELHVNEERLEDFKTLVKLSPIAKETYENLQDDGSHGKFGVSRQWMIEAKKYWEEKFDWRKEESYINSFPNFKTNIIDDNGGDVFEIHFAALFSKGPNAIPIAFFHGWPGSFLEFLPLMDILRKKYTPETLPYHIIVPSLPGFGLSSGPPLDKDWIVADTSRIMHKLLLSLGFGSTGYLVQGGDIGSLVCRAIAATYDECKGMHVNFMLSKDIEPKSSSEVHVTEVEKKGIQRMRDFRTKGYGYNLEHGTKPSTIGLVLSSSPIAQLAWIGEKFLAWSDPATTPSLNTILSDVTLYWFTECYPSSIYAYRETLETPYVDKPVGYSYFPWELAPIPKSWAEKTARIEYFRAHEKGGHFAALEVPEVLLADVEEWVKVAWSSGPKL